MSAILHLTPIGQDKTALSISLLRQLVDSRQNDLPAIWVLLATRRQEFQFRQRLLDAKDSPPAFFNIEFFNFYTLNARLLKIAGAPVRRLTPLMRHKLLRQLLARMSAEGSLDYFRLIADKRGFISVLAELIDEFKQNGISDSDFAAAARSPKDREIAMIYRHYQDALRQSDLADVEGEGWLALAELKKQPDLVARADMLLVDGYDQFTLVQSQLLAELSRGIQRAHITLTALPDDRAAHYKSRSSLARRRLQSAFDEAGFSLKHEQARENLDPRCESLRHLTKSIFRDRPPRGSGDALRFIAMPDPAEETRAVFRAVKRLLLSGAAPDSILIAIRDWDRYAAFLEAGRADYALPLSLHYHRCHRESPAVARIVDLLELAPRFRRRDLLDMLRSPYFDTGLDDALIDLLDRLSRDQRFPGGSRADWLALVDLAQKSASHGNEDESSTTVTSDQARNLSAALANFLDAITPVERAELSDYCDWLATLLGPDPAAPEETNNAGSLNTIRNAWEHDQANPAIVARDISALNGLKRILREMMASDVVMRASMRANAQVTWQEFWSDLKFGLDTSADDSHNQPRKDQVLVATAAEARGLPHDYVFILGLAEGVFPAEATEDPLYLDSERERMQRAGFPLMTRAQRIDDRGLFYELISLARTSLTLSRPTFQEGRVWIESYLWRAVRAIFPDAPLHSSPVGQAIHPRDAANSPELMVALADQISQPDAASAELALRARNWLRSQPNLAESWRRLESFRAVELSRLSNAPYDQYSGVLARLATRQEAARRLGEQQIFSASRLKDYGLCGFRYLAKRLLKLEEISEPEAGVDLLQLGSLNHRILEETYRQIAVRGLRIHADNLEEASAIVREVSADILATAPADFNFRATAAWEAEKQMLVNRLAALIRLDFSAKSPLNRFGKSRTIYDLEHAFDDVTIPLPDGMSPLRVAGFIDRIDLADGKLVVVDYKTGSATISRLEMEIGRDFQMLVYTEALANRLREDDAEPSLAGGAFWHLRNLKTSGRLSADNEADRSALESAKAHIARNLSMGRAGKFPVHATKLENRKCARYCEFSRLCRLHVTSRYKELPDNPRG